jgi:hypothetical protein
VDDVQDRRPTPLELLDAPGQLGGWVDAALAEQGRPADCHVDPVD